MKNETTPAGSPLSNTLMNILINFVAHGAIGMIFTVLWNLGMVELGAPGLSVLGGLGMWTMWMMGFLVPFLVCVAIWRGNQALDREYLLELDAKLSKKTTSPAEHKYFTVDTDGNMIETTQEELVKLAAEAIAVQQKLKAGMPSEGDAEKNDTTRQNPPANS